MGLEARGDRAALGLMGPHENEAHLLRVVVTNVAAGPGRAPFHVLSLFSLGLGGRCSTSVRPETSTATWSCPRSRKLLPPFPR